MIAQFFGLKKTCIHPTTLRPYIVSISGGKDISTENLQVCSRSKFGDRQQSDLLEQNGISHAFVLQFHSIEDRDYYVNDDPVHKTFKEAAASALEKAIVVDYQNGVFTSV